MGFYNKLYNYTNNINDVYAISKDLGGCNIYIPKKIIEGHFLNIYSDDFKKFLLENFAGKTIYIPIFKEDNFLIKNLNQLSILKKIKILLLKSYQFKK